PRTRSRTLRRLAGALLVAGAAVALWIGAAILFLDSFIFYPERSGDWEARRRSRFRIEEVELGTPDGERLVSWFLRVEAPRASVLFFHGNAGNLTHRLDVLETLAGLGLDAFVLGYRGYGRSTGKASEAGLYLDAEAAYAHVTGSAGVAPDRLLLLGESLGCAVAVDLAAKRPCAGIVLQSPFLSIAEMATQVIPLPPLKWIVPRKFDNLGRIPKVAAPKLFLAARRDEVVPFGQTRRLFEAAPGEKEWAQFEDCGHNDLFLLHRREWTDAVARFVDRVCPAR
ncbi:MAG: alpha/beta hydrolase, partial [Planctomycetota bacterium]